MKRNFLLISFITLSVIVIAAVMYFLSVSRDQAGSDPDIFLGEFVCLPHADPGEVHTLECEFGIETNGGLYYAIDISKMDQARASEFNTGEYVEVMGAMTRRVDIDQDDRLLIYDIAGVIVVAEMRHQVSAGVEMYGVEGGLVTFEVPPDFTVVEEAHQITVESAVPPCGDSFDYCVYLNNDAYLDTNFTSAGVRIMAREDLVEQGTCLTLQPAGFSHLTRDTNMGTLYAASRFYPLESVSSDHSSTGVLYRLFTEGVCYEVETRLAVQNMDAYEPGPIEVFTPSDRMIVEGAISKIIRSVRVPVEEGATVLEW